MSTAEAPELAPAAESSSSLGAKLRESRIAAKLSVSEVASQLHFGEAIIQQLEDEQFEDFPAPTFVRGYLRAYAKLLGLPDAPLLKALEQHRLHSPELVADIAEPHQAKSTDTPVRMATYAIFGGLLLLLALWWHSEYGMSFFGYGAQTPAPTGNPPSTQIDSAAPQVLAPIPPMATVNFPPPSLETEPPTPSEAAILESPVPVAGIAIVPPPPPPVVEASPPSPQQVSLSLTFAHDSWVEVYDGDGNRIFLDLAREGTTLDLTGIAPVDVLLGYAQGVAIKYNGQDFDFQPFVHQGVARFQLGGAEEPPAIEGEPEASNNETISD